MRDKLEAGILESLPNAVVNGHPTLRLPNTLSISFPRIAANTILAELNDIAVSAGAACHSDRVELSPVLKAMGKSEEVAMGTIRLSTGRQTTPSEIDSAIGEIVRVVKSLQPEYCEPANIPSGESIRLTMYTQGLGCACKLRPQLLEQLLRLQTPISDPNLLVGTDSCDDAAVYRISEDTAIVQTVDFFTPIVDDPYMFGAISAANSLSDIYAMGARPLFALNIVAFPSNRLPMSVLAQILKGAEDKATEAGIAIVGGHTVDDTEPKFGLAVTGLVHPDRIWHNVGAKIGDVLLLTKPIGTGIITTTAKRGICPSEVIRSASDSMAQLNGKAAEIAGEYDIHACTDITGFGLLGHLKEMMGGNNTSAVIHYSSVPLLTGVYELAIAGTIPGGTENNHSFTLPYVCYNESLSMVKRMILNDAQTSGGLLLALSPADADELSIKLRSAGLLSAVVGVVTEKGEWLVRVEE